jgi:tRNA1(Val) A37 N6-methylase TrmN6
MRILLERGTSGARQSRSNRKSFIDNLTDKSLIADIGCDTGGQTMILAQHTPAQIQGIDLFPAFIDKFNANVDKLNLCNRVKGFGLRE